MPRGRRTEPLYPAFEDWRAARDRRGLWSIVNSRGEHPLQHPDPLVRMHAVYLAAHAPELRAALLAVATRLQGILLDHGAGYTRDMALTREAFVVIAGTRPPFVEALRLRAAGQLELSIGEEDAAPANRGTGQSARMTVNRSG